MRRLTASEYQELMDSMSKYEDDTLFSKPDTRAGFSAGFVYGLDYQQAKLDKLIAFIRGKITRSEIEDLLNA